MNLSARFLIRGSDSSTTPFSGVGCMGLLCFMFIKPVVWFPVLVRHRDDKNMVLVYGVKQLVQQTFSYIATCYGSAFRVCGNSERGLSYLFLEFASKP